jgi:hypothetical protein
VNWHWRNCRDIGVSFSLWPLTWNIGLERDGDVYGMEYRLSFGPLLIQLHANIGNASSESRFEAWRGLSEAEACERAMKYEGRAAGLHEGEGG